MKNQTGFTLIELIAILVILGVMASVGLKKLDLLSDTATNRILREGVKELNIRESLTWTNIKLSPAGWENDEEVFASLDTNLGSNYKWTAGPNTAGGILRFRSHSISLTRMLSTTSSIGSWK